MTNNYLIDTLVELAQVSSAVPLGQDTLIAPDHPVLVHYVQQELRRRFIETGAFDIVDLPMNQLAVRFGDGDGPSLALMAYTPTQHHNLMSDPLSGRIRTPVELGIDEPCLFGQGVTQNKSHQACLLSLARSLVEAETPIKGTLLLCVNNEGRSTHDCSNALLDALPIRPDLLVELMNTGFEVSVGNRGRIDIYVHVRGQATHSSSPPAQGRVIEATSEAIRRIERLNETVSTRTDPILGAEHAVPYQVVFEPLAPHTLPSYGKVTVDRRIVSPTDGTAETAEIRAALTGLADATGCEIEVETGVMMLPGSYPEHAAPLLHALDGSIREVLKAEPEHVIYGGSFDAGGPLARGIPTVMFGVPDEGDILGDDFVRLSAVSAEDRILHSTVAAFFGLPRL
jgi:acetylornithine deacetylase/succinyl-diaminopimelate desuccinylase-like protein